MKVFNYLGWLLFFSANVDATVLLSENFHDINALPGKGWVQTNNSAPEGTTGWFQGDPSLGFSAQTGAADSYIAANFNNADSFSDMALSGNVSNWLLSPNLTLNNGDQLIFYTRSEGILPDRLQVRLSTNGISGNVGETDASVGDFTALLLDINPGLEANRYPSDWALETITLSGLSTPVSGRIGFRYWVTDNNSNGDYIGIDTLSVITPVPVPATLYFLGSGLLGLWCRKHALAAQLKQALR